jgi:hypothetical protein
VRLLCIDFVAVTRANGPTETRTVKALITAKRAFVGDLTLRRRNVSRHVHFAVAETPASTS